MVYLSRMTVTDLIRFLGDLPPDAVVVVCTNESPRSGHFKPLAVVDRMDYDAGTEDVGDPSDGFEGEPCAVLWPDFE